jgi:hypothetical protein
MLASDILHLTFFPVGTILMYDGNSWTDNVTLKGWYRCDAANAAAGRTPDLTDKFIMGGSSKGATGGSNNMTLSANNLPKHKHEYTTSSTSKTLTGWTGVGGSGGVPSNGVFENKRGNRDVVISGPGIVYEFGTWFDGTHSHSGATNENSSSNTSFDNRPSYYALIYIRKCA